MTKTKTFAGFLAGAVVGIIAFIMFAPDKGKQTWNKLAGKSKDVSDEVDDSIDKFTDDFAKSVSNAKSELTND